MSATDPGYKSAAEIEREVEGTRARLTGTIEELKDRVSPGQMLEQAMDYVRGSGGQEFVANLGRTVRDNPLPILLIGAGIGWLMMSGGRQDGYRAAGLPPAPRRTSTGMGTSSSHMGMGHGGEGNGLHGSYSSSSSGPSLGQRASGVAASLREGAGDAAGALRDSVAGAASQAGEALSTARNTVADAASRAGSAVAEAWQSVTETAGSTASDVSRRASYWAESGYESVSGLGGGLGGLMQRQPLVAGGIGLIIGAALGAVLPGSEAEDRLMGETRDQVASRVADLAEQGYQQAKAAAGEQLAHVQEAASEVYGRVRGQIDESGLTPQRGAEALGQVAREVREAVEQTARDVAGQARDAAGNGSGEPPRLPYRPGRRAAAGGAASIGGRSSSSTVRVTA
ncbi:DUF3618 domain-containing protein [Falsiroseomonas sp. CW058]|uniref:DUF3618 domain-containing protein n=1 Tax=Falsiroseomonas sp. CW058 TaxID=3388664 RepID=UPI003D323E5E